MRKSWLAFLVLFCSGEVFANNLFIPNYYRNRREVNQYSAIGWSNRNEAAVRYSVENNDVKTNGTKSSDNSETILYPHAFYRTPINLNIEAAVESASEERKSLPGGAKRKIDGMGYHLGLGYEIADTPVAFGVAVKMANVEDKPAAGAKTTTDDMSASIGVGYKLAEDLYLGAGYTNDRSKTKGAKEDQDNTYVIGVGKVMGDRANPTGAAEAALQFSNEDHSQTYGLLAQGLVNSELLQYHGLISYANTTGDTKGYGLGLMVGADYQFMDFYVGPQVSYLTLDTKTSGVSTKINGWSPGLEAGYRLDFFEAFLRYEMGDTETKLVGKTKSDYNILTAQLTYKF